MTGKLLAAFTVIAALLAGAGIYYTQVYAFYETLPAEAPAARITLVSLATDAPEAIAARDVQAIDSDSSPLRFRACFTTPLSQAMLTETFEIAENAVPLTGPGWFDCYDAKMVGEALESGDAIAFLAQRDVHEGVDRMIAIFPDGRGFAWHQLNDKYKD